MEMSKFMSNTKILSGVVILVYKTIVKGIFI